MKPDLLRAEVNGCCSVNGNCVTDPTKDRASFPGFIGKGDMTSKEFGTADKSPVFICLMTSSGVEEVLEAGMMSGISYTSGIH
jgi:hypothetical protein